MKKKSKIIISISIILLLVVSGIVLCIIQYIIPQRNEEEEFDKIFGDLKKLNEVIHNNPAKDIKKLLDSAAESQEKSLVFLYVYMGEMSYRAEKNQQAISYLVKAENLAKKIYSKNHYIFAMIYMHMGQTYESMNKNTAAEKYLRKAVNLSEYVNPAETGILKARIFYSLGAFIERTDQSRLNESIIYLDKSLDLLLILKQKKDEVPRKSRVLAIVRSRILEAHYFNKDYKKAIHLFNDFFEDNYFHNHELYVDDMDSFFWVCACANKLKDSKLLKKITDDGMKLSETLKTENIRVKQQFILCFYCFRSDAFFYEGNIIQALHAIYKAKEIGQKMTPPYGKMHKIDQVIEKLEKILLKNKSAI